MAHPAAPELSPARATLVRGARLTAKQQHARLEQSVRGFVEHGSFQQQGRGPFLAGALLRLGPEYWRWSDGTAELRVGDCGVSDQSFPLRRQGGETLVEVHRSVLELVPLLGWVLAGWRAGRFAEAPSPVALRRPVPLGARCTIAWPGEAPCASERRWLEPCEEAPAAVLVPLGEWNAWAATSPAAAVWDSRHDAAILDRAWARGWRPASGYVSPAGWTAPVP